MSKFSDIPDDVLDEAVTRLAIDQYYDKPRRQLFALTGECDCQRARRELKQLLLEEWGNEAIRRLQGLKDNAKCSICGADMSISPVE